MKSGKGERILIAGGAGFIGSYLCEAYLAEGAQVVCLDNLHTGLPENVRAFGSDPRFDLIEADIATVAPKKVAGKGSPFSLIINAACPASPPHYQADPQHTLLTCVVGTNMLLGLAEQHGARFVMCSTSEVYGDPLVHPQAETYWGNVNPTGPRACYDEGKRAAETLCFDYLRQARVDVRVARIFNTYGPRMRADDGRVVSNIVCQALADADITIYGEGRQTRSFCYVSDMVDGLMRLAAHKGPLQSAINLGNPNEITIADLVSTVLEMIDTRSTVVKLPLPPDDPQRRRPDIALAKRHLDWQPTVDLATGLSRTIAHFARQFAGDAKTLREPLTAVDAR
ncbi:UDP-glucuronic acid decarboxylase family protein [Lichenifustis flavocetrariae]|uniref:SDR family oxidoreductase n=1 Tax=Lichenifustis flavocetrariae TaxID=2949735 RepID=A0AA41YUL8_9HYPH|nr:SDR family oxidoreductase [Lichenifustis flavocetrariae]MCW6507183.1 SDR family oxidoreductase [Lichenifustis flavocetrariae]